MHSIKHIALSLHQRLLPQSHNLGVLPYIWLLYLSMFFVHFLLYQAPVWHYWAAAVGTVCFLILYFRAFWKQGRALLGYILAITALGALMTFLNSGSAVFFVFACAFANQVGSVRQGFMVVGLVLGCIALVAWALSQPLFFTLPAMLFSLLIGSINIFQHELAHKNALLKLSQDEIQRLAATAERERIARDLHDVTGHTLSMITMKAQLANKLFEHDTKRARQEIAELERISRQALADVREAVSGYRQQDLHSEVTNARTMLHSADIAFYCDIAADNLPKEIDATLGFAVREATTNLIRHSSATTCNMAIQSKQNMVSLKIYDNGQVDTFKEGNGLTGMRERIGKLNGSVAFDTADGFTIDIEMPV